MPLLEDELVQVRLKTLPADADYSYFQEHVDKIRYPRGIIPSNAKRCETYIIPQEGEEFAIEVVLKAGFRFYSAKFIGVQIRLASQFAASRLLPTEAFIATL